jgi:hypothetical protein
LQQKASGAATEPSEDHAAENNGSESMKLRAGLLALSMTSIFFFSSEVLAMGTSAQILSRNAAPIGAEILYKLYRNKTWLWPNGAAFFEETGRFSAWSEAGGEAAYAKGQWWVNFLGDVCIKAAWRTKHWSKVNLTCFGHKEDATGLYQKREPSGDWVTFRSTPSRTDDECENLKEGNIIDTDLHRIEAEVNEE